MFTRAQAGRPGGWGGNGARGCLGGLTKEGGTRQRVTREQQQMETRTRAHKHTSLHVRRSIILLSRRRSQSKYNKTLYMYVRVGGIYLVRTLKSSERGKMRMRYEEKRRTTTTCMRRPHDPILSIPSCPCFHIHPPPSIHALLSLSLHP